ATAPRGTRRASPGMPPWRSSIPESSSGPAGAWRAPVCWSATPNRWSRSGRRELADHLSGNADHKLSEVAFLLGFFDARDGDRKSLARPEDPSRAVEARDPREPRHDRALSAEREARSEL